MLGMRQAPDLRARENCLPPSDCHCQATREHLCTVRRVLPWGRPVYTEQAHALHVGRGDLRPREDCSLDAPAPLSRERRSLNGPTQPGGAPKRWVGTPSAVTPGTFPSQSLEDWNTGPCWLQGLMSPSRTRVLPVLTYPWCVLMGCERSTPTIQALSTMAGWVLMTQAYNTACLSLWRTHSHKY